MEKKKVDRLTLKKAKEFIKKEFGLSGTALITESSEDGAYIYKMQLGKFEITVQNDWYLANGLLMICIQSPIGCGIQTFYNPETLELDYDACNEYRKELETECCEGCSYKNGHEL